MNTELWLETKVYPFAVFGLAATATDEEFASAYARLLSRFPPESASQEYDEIQQSWPHVRNMDARAATWARWRPLELEQEATDRALFWLRFHSQRRWSTRELIQKMRQETQS